MIEQRPLQPTPVGALRFNTDNARLEYFDGNVYQTIPTDSPEINTGGTRGIFGGGETPSLTDRIDFINVDSTGNAADFGDLSFNRRNLKSTSDRTRLIFTGGYTSGPAVVYNTLEFVTMASTGDVTDFGDLTQARSRHSGFASSTRGFAAGGMSSPSPTTMSEVIDFVTIQSTGNAVDFGNMTSARLGPSGAQSPTRGLMFGGKDSETRNIIEYITMSSTGNAADFGDLSNDSSQGTAGSNAVRAIAGSGYISPGTSTTLMQFVTIANLGNAVDFGNLAQNHIECGEGACSPTRIVIPGSFSSNNNPSNTIEYAQIMTTGNFIDFGDLSSTATFMGGTSNGHGGLG